MVLLPPYQDDIIKRLICKKIQFQVAGVDLTVANIYSIPDGGVIDFNNAKRFIPEYHAVEKNEDYWHLEPGAYLIRYNEVVTIPRNSIGIVLPRSTLMRIGATIYSALWDPGYEGRGVSLMHTFKQIKIFENARIAQLILIKTEGLAESYQGNYQFEGIEENY